MHAWLKVSLPSSQPVWVTAPLSEVTLLFLRAMTKRTKPRHYQSHSDREIRRSSPGTATTTVKTQSKWGGGVVVWPSFGTSLPQSLTQLTRNLLRQNVWVFLFDNHFFYWNSLFVKEARESCFTSWRLCGIEPCQVRMTYRLHTNKTVSNLGNEFNNTAAVGYRPVQDKWLSSTMPMHFLKLSYRMWMGF